MKSKEKMSISIVKEAIKMAWPAVCESFFVALAGMVDSLMVSSMGASAVAAVGLTTQPKFMGLALFFAVNVSVSALVARRRGEQRKDAANQLLMAVFVFVISAILLQTSSYSFCGTLPQSYFSCKL